jgi:hypothetical protein
MLPRSARPRRDDFVKKTASGRKTGDNLEQTGCRPFWFKRASGPSLLEIGDNVRHINIPAMFFRYSVMVIARPPAATERFYRRDRTPALAGGARGERGDLKWFSLRYKILFALSVTNTVFQIF